LEAAKAKKHSTLAWPGNADLAGYSNMANEVERAIPRSPAPWLTLARGLGVLVVYFLAGKFGLSLAFMNASASPIWPPTGIALAVILLWGSGFAVPVFIGAFLVNITTQGSLGTSLAIAAGNTLEGLVGAWLVSRFAGGPNSFGRPRCILAYIGLGALLSTAVSPTVGVTSLCSASFTPWNQYGASWLTWWLGDVVSDVTIAPLILIWATEPVARLTRENLFVASVIAATIVVLNTFIFPVIFSFRDKNIPIEYLAILPLLWAAFRFGQRGAISSAAITAGFALWGTLHGLGPYIKPDLNESLILMQAFIATITVTALLVAAVVSEQRIAEQVLRAKEAELRLITDMTPLMLTRCTRDLRYAFVNRAYAGMVGASPEQLVGKPIREIVGEPGFETIRQRIEKVLHGDIVDYETDVQFKGVGGRYLRVVSQPDRDEHGQIRGWIDSITDITERKQAEITRARLSSIVESSDDAIISKDLKGRIVTWNNAAEHMFGYGSQEIIGQHVTRIVPAQLRQQEEELLSRLRRGESIRQFETLRLSKDGSTIPVSLSISPLKDSQGKIVGSCSISRDVTERKRAEQALEKAKADLENHAKDLEKIVAERTAQLRESNTELEAFSFSLSHDLRAPLRAIRNFTQIVLEEQGRELGAEAAANLERVVAAAKRLDRMIRDVLALSRISRQDLNSCALDVENLLRTIINERPEFQSPRAEIEISTPIPNVCGDEASLSQCVTNLLDNAVKFVPAGTRPKVIIRSESVGSRVRLSFEDNGIGIDRALHQKIFEVFQRAHGGRRYEGSGLGLAIVRKAVERMGGTVGVESEIGQGSRFWLELPRT
jgi:PAS domain S-box-containing protein